VNVQVSVAVRDSWIDAADGVKLRCRIWTPAGQGPWPVLLMRQPYGRAIASTITYAHPNWYASHGFAVVVQDVRGRGGSEGDFAGFSQERMDGTTTLSWLRSQSWCSGRVGCYGFSYQGFSQLALSNDSQLPDALAPAMAGLDERLHWASEGGSHWWALGVGWGLQLAAQGCQRRGDQKGWRAIRHSLDSGAFLHEGLELLKLYDPDGMAANWLQRDPAIAEGWRVHTPPASIWQKPMLLIGGWHDPHLNGVLDLWQRSRAAGGQPLLRVGAWSHLQWNGGVDELQLAFFSYHLRDQVHAAPQLSELACLQDLGTHQWQQRDPEQCSAQRWRLNSNGLAAIQCDEGQLVPEDRSASGTFTLVHDPWRPLPGRGGHLGLDAGCVERSDLDRRSDVACFTSAAIDQPINVMGRPMLELEAMADQPGFDLCAALSVAKPDGSVLQISAGVARWRGEPCLAMATRTLQLQPLLLTLQPGERLRLSIGLAAWPHIAVNKGDGSLPAGAAGPEHRVISVSLQLSNAWLSIQPMVGAN